MNIMESFANYLEELEFGVFGESIFIGSVPLEAPDPCIWLVQNGGSNEIKATTGEKLKNYNIGLYYRSLNSEEVYNTIQTIEETLNANPCTQLNSFVTIELEAISYNVDQDLDLEDRSVGYIEVIITVYN